jgi:hypothetical protein
MASAETDWPNLRFAAIGEAWRLYKRHWSVWSLTMLVSLLCYGVGQGLSAGVLHISLNGMFGGLMGFGAPSAPFMSLVLGSMVGGFFLGGMVRMAIGQVRGRAPRIEDLFSVTDVWFDLILGSALLVTIVTIGLNLMVLPGLVAAGLFMFTFPLIVDGRLPATGALIQSVHTLKSQWLLATAVHLVMSMITGFGFFCFVIGLLVTGPLYALTLAVLYRDLLLNPYSPSWSKPPGDHDEF